MKRHDKGCDKKKMCHVGTRINRVPMCYMKIENTKQTKMLHSFRDGSNRSAQDAPNNMIGAVFGNDDSIGTTIMKGYNAQYNQH